MHKSGIICCIVLFCIVIIGENQALGCLKDEKIGLLKLKHVLNNHNRSVPSTWSDEQVEDCCSWEGVICSDDMFSKRIINLSLTISFILSQDSSDLVDAYFLDASLFQPFEELQNLTFHDFTSKLQGFKGSLRLAKLQVLDLSNNFGMSTIPLMGELPSLKFLDLSDNMLMHHDFQELTLGGNGIKGQIPPSIWALTSLKALGLSYNMLNGSLPEGLCTLTNLEELDLSNNAFEGFLPTCLSNLTSLQLLDLSGNKFSGSIPPNLFSGLKSLQYVFLSHNLFDGLFSFSSFADHSKLKGFRLENDNPMLKVETENAQLKFPLFQLKVLILSNCILNEPSGVIPSFLLSQYDLRVVDLSNNGMTGELPSWLLSNNSKLESLSLRNNYFSGQFMLQLDAYHAYMGWLDVSNNQVSGEIPTYIGSILPNLTYLNMSTNTIEGSIPSSIENIINLEMLDLSNNRLCVEFLGDLFIGCKELSFLKLSNNNFGGNLTNFLPNILRLPQLKVLYLDNNNFSGDLQLETLHLARGAPLILLDISNNLISGRFPDWIAKLTYLNSLALSKNQFEGELPASFCNLSPTLIFLDLSWNNFSGFLPPCSNLPSIMFLHLQGNGFHGPLPISLNRSSQIVTLDVRDNKFSGLIPAWISSLPNLSLLLLKGNLFNGSLPLELCWMNLSILDLGTNNLSGLVPICLSEIPFGKNKHPYLDFTPQWLYYGPASEYSYEDKLHVIGNEFSPVYWVSNVVEEVQFITKSRSESYKGNILHYLSGIDLSLNKFTGHIPLEFGKLDMVYSLNLSNNHFNGSIPWTLSGLKNIESLDLSHNMLSGEIPSEITKLTSLSVFSVAYNNLSGSTPTRTNQFGTFVASSYEGNPLLCGLPLDISCTGRLTPPPHAKTSAELEENDTSFKTTFLWSFIGSFVVSCIGAFVFFYFCSKVPQMFLGWLGVEERVPRKRTVELPWRMNK